jgi:ribonuclease HI
MLILMCDGSSRGNPGPASIAVIIWQREPGTSAARRFRPTHKIREEIGIGTNNEAEWRAVLRGMQYAKEIGYKGDIYIYTDSMLVVQQANRKWHIGGEKMKEYNKEFDALKAAMGPGASIDIAWVPRQLTRLADAET